MGYADTAMAMTDGLSSGGSATQVGAPAGGSFVNSGAGLPVSNGVEETYQANWGTNAAGVKNRLGQDFGYSCPPNGSISSIYGTDVYSAAYGTSICTAAVHSGLITVKSGGNVTIRIIRHKGVFIGTERNSIVSYGAGGNSSPAFIFVSTSGVSAQK